MSCFYFHSCQSIFLFPVWFLLWPIGCLRVLFNFHIFVNFPVFFLLFIVSFQVCQRRCFGWFQSFKIYWYLLWAQHMVYVPCAFEKNGYSAVFISLLTCLVVLSINWKWKSPAIFELCLFIFNSANFCFIHLGSSVVRCACVYNCYLFFHPFTFKPIYVFGSKVNFL